MYSRCLWLLCVGVGVDFHTRSLLSAFHMASAEVMMWKLHFRKRIIVIEKLSIKLRSSQNANVKRLFKKKISQHKAMESKTKSISTSCRLLQAMMEERNSDVKVPFLRRGTRLNYLHDGSFHEAISPVLVMAQFFCLMPVRGVRVKSIKKLSFQWLSFRTCYCLLYMTTTIIDTILTINMVAHGDLDVRNMEPVIFHISILLASIGFLRLAAQWPQLMRKWKRVENRMPEYGNWIEREALARRIKMVTIVLITLSLTEHLLSTISAIHFANYCPARSDPVESYLHGVVSHIFFVFEYRNWLGWLGKIQNILMTFGWSYMDVFVSIMGIGLSALFGRVQNSMERVQGQPMPEKYWTTAREQYRLICDLIEEVDVAISGITMLSFANNLYFVCIQLLKSINKMPSAAHAIYFYFSLMFLLGRTLAVSLFLSEVNDRSRRPLLMLKLIPSTAYYDDVERFSREMAIDVVALTGLKFFKITRKLVLTVAGTIVTYELVLIQFHEDQKLWNCGTD